MTPHRVTSLSRDERLIRAFLAGGLLAGLAVVSLVPPAYLPIPTCLFRSITGHDCLTCGMTRSLHALAHGDLAAAVHYHLFGPAVFTLIVIYLALFASEAIRGRTRRSHLLSKD